MNKLPKGIYKRKPFSEGAKRNMSKAHKGKPNNRLGTHLPEETKKKISEKLMGKSLPKETRRKMSEARRREKNPSWKGGFTINANGYLLFKAPKGCRFSSMKNKDGYIYMHRLMMAEYLQRPLRPEEIVHHKNEDITDNRMKNFKLLKSKGEHNSLHFRLRKNEEEK